MGIERGALAVRPGEIEAMIRDGIGGGALRGDFG
jgi:hypothetical protein